MKRLLPVAVFALAACPAPAPQPDASTPDSGIDAGAHDGGHVPRDAGFDAGFTDVTPSTWCHDNALAQCFRDERCGRIDDTTLPGCLATRTYGCNDDDYVVSVADHKLAFDPQLAAQCLNGYAFGSCEDTPAACATAMVGLTPPGEGCFIDSDCDPDAGYCDLYDFTCPHRCAAWAALGQNCAGDFTPRCQPGLGCEFADGGSMTTCIVPHVEGEGCNYYDSCAPGLLCSFDSPSTCLKLLANEGEPCAVQFGYPQCSSDAFCRVPPPATMGGPTPPGVCEHRSGLGGACLGYGTCLPSLRCSSGLGTGICLRFAALGESCSHDYYGEGDCQDGLYCALTTSKCSPLPGDAGDCTSSGSDFRCAPGYFCGFDGGCQAQEADNAPCDYAGECLSNECAYLLLPDGGYPFSDICVRCALVADGGS